MITDAVSPLFGGLEEVRHFGLVQGILAPLMGIRGDRGGRRNSAPKTCALTPLIWEHVTPYGRFELDMNARLPLD
jgi:hypothetical protein